MKHRSIIIALALILPLCSYSQEEGENWLSAGRLSLTTSASYHYAPWERYNESMKLVQDAIRFSPTNQNPQGNLEKILGDGSIDLTAAYRLISGLSVFIRSSYLAGGGSFNLSFNPYGYPDPIYTSYHSQKMRLEVREYGAGFRYTQRLNRRFELAAFGSVFRSLGSVQFDYRYSQTDEEDLFSVELNDGRTGISCGIELVFTTSRHFSIVSSVDYRWIKFPELQGTGTYVWRYTYDWGVYESSKPFDARLGQADGYFGLFIDSRKTGFDRDNVLHTLWGGTPTQPFWYNQRPDVLDLSGVGVSLGVRYAF